MGWIDNLRGIFTPGQNVRAVDAKQVGPTQADIPRSWANAYMGPGQPMGMMPGTTARERDREQEPRSFEYSPGVNSTMSPRAAYGLMTFSDLRQYAESVPEVAMCVRIITEEIKSFQPQILSPDGSECLDPSLAWMRESPDRFNPWPVWLSRFLYNVLVYDAGAVYMKRIKRGRMINSMRVIDGSTLFVMVDEYGEQPKPPAPAFTQVIYGTPRNYFNTHQVWYRPRHLRADAPYGRSPIEDCLPAVKLLAAIWEYEGSWYTEGNTPEQVMTAPPDYTVEQVLDFERTYNSRMAGNVAERAGRIRFMPSGVTAIATKDARFREDIYNAAANTVRMTYGIPRTELGESPGSGLGGSGFLEAMQNVFYRLGLGPVKSYVESLFNAVLSENGYEGYEFQLAFPKESIDPKKEEEKAMSRFTQGVSRRDETRQALGMQAIGGPEGEFLISPGAAGGADPGMPGMPGGAPGQMIPVSGGKIPVSSKVHVANNVPVSQNIPVSDSIPVNDGDSDLLPVRKAAAPRASGTGVAPEDDLYFGAPVSGGPGNFTIGGERLTPRAAAWEEVEPLDEAVYLLDRALAPNDQRYLVPVTYQADFEGRMGQVTIPVAGRRPKGVTGFGEDWREQAAVLDYLAGVTRKPSGVVVHPDDPKRPILLPTGLAMGLPSSPFVSEFAGRDLSAEMARSAQAVAGDEVLYRDIATIAGDEAAAGIRERARMLILTGRLPVVS